MRLLTRKKEQSNERTREEASLCVSKRDTGSEMSQERHGREQRRGGGEEERSLIDRSSSIHKTDKEIPVEIARRFQLKLQPARTN